MSRTFLVERKTNYRAIDSLQYWTARYLWNELPHFGKKRNSDLHRMAAEKLIGYGV